MAKVSVIIPVYNVANYLSQCLDSVCGQTLTDIEIICINDGSTDSSLSILEQYAARDSRIKIISTTNNGVSAARNIGLTSSTGDFIGFVDSDDWIPANFFEKLYQTAISLNVDICGGGIKYYGKNKTKKMLTYHRTKTAENITAKFHLFNIPTYNYIWNKLYRRELILGNNLLFTEGIVYEDMIWLPQITALAAKVAVIPGVEYYYRYNASSIVNTTQHDFKKEQDYKTARQFQNDFILKNKIKIELPYDKKTKYHILGLPVLKIQESSRLKKYYLFGIKVMQATITPKI